MPTSTAVAVQILAMIEDPNSTADQFSAIIQADPSLAGRLLKVSNSPRYHRPNPVTTIQRAATVIGLRQLRLLMLGFELVGHLDRLGGCPFDMQRFWQESLLHACLCRETAARIVPALAEEAFLVGLLQDCGIPMLVQVCGDSYADLYQSYRSSPQAFHAREQRLYPYTHVDAVMAMASMWNLPECLLGPLASQHDPPALSESPSPGELLAATSYFAGSIGFSEAGEDVSTEHRLRDYALQTLNLTDDDLDALITSSEEMYRSTTELFAESLPEDVDISELLMVAKRKLATEAEYLQRDLECARSDLEEMEAERLNLAASLAEYRERASLDPLTGLLNRGALIEMTDHCLRLAMEQELPIAMLFLDIDDFKQVNDQYGHLAGDQILKSVSATMVKLLEGGIVGRFGGEEFILVVPGFTAGQVEELSERLVCAIRQMRFPEPEMPRSVTCSIGALWVRPTEHVSSEALIASSDALMYDAKQGGKDRFRFGTLGSGRGECLTAGADSESSDRDPGGIDGSVVSPLDTFHKAAEALSRDHESAPVSQRKHERQTFFSPCILTSLVDRSLRVRHTEAYVRNISPGGVGVVTTRPLVRGDLVEVSLDYNASRLYLGGCVAYCEHTSATIYDVGIQLSQQAQEPIFSIDPKQAADTTPWIALALTERYGEHDELRPTA